MDYLTNMDEFDTTTTPLEAANDKIVALILKQNLYVTALNDLLECIDETRGKNAFDAVLNAKKLLGIIP